MSDTTSTEVPATGAEGTTTVIEPTITETATPKPSETLDYWKARSRENEARAKTNADAAQRLAEFENSQKSEAQRHADAAEQAKRDAAEARAEMTRYKVASTQGVPADYFDLLGSGDEEAVTARAQLLKPLLDVRAENEQLKAQIATLQGKPAGTNRPVADLKPGATPDGASSESDVLYNSLFPSGN